MSMLSIILRETLSCPSNSWTPQRVRVRVAFAAMPKPAMLASEKVLQYYEYRAVLPSFPLLFSLSSCLDLSVFHDTLQTVV